MKITTKYHNSNNKKTHTKRKQLNKIHLTARRNFEIDPIRTIQSVGKRYRSYRNVTAKPKEAQKTVNIKYVWPHPAGLVCHAADRR